MEKVVRIESMINAQVSIAIPTLNLRRSWERKGAIQQIEFRDLEMAFYEPGVEGLLRGGILYVNDEEARIALGLEDKENGISIIKMDAAKSKEVLEEMSLKDFKELLEQLTPSQIEDLADEAVKLRLTDLNKAEAIKNKSGINVAAKVLAAKEDDAEKAKANAEKK
jgi:hypothetical protein